MDFQKVKAVIFDLDGTLLDTLGDVGGSVNEGLRRLGYAVHPISDYRVYIGHGIRQLIGLAVPEGAPEDTTDKVLAHHLVYYPEHCTVHTSHFEGSKALLQALTEKGIRLAVISNKTESTSQKIVEHYFPEFTWEFIWGSNGSRPLKPAIDAGRLACEALGLQPEEIMYVGDGDTDMKFASSMGFVAAGVTWGYRDPDQLLAAGADFLCDSFPELQEKMGL